MNIFHRTFRRAAWIEVVVDAAIERQSAFEELHPVQTDPATRLEAVIQRAEQICREHGAAIIPHERIEAVIRVRLERP
jgi:hypothetical protein